MTTEDVRMPSARLFRAALGRELGEGKAAEVVHGAGERYRDLYAGRKRYANKALRKHLEGSILPGVALYRALAADPDTCERAMPLFEVVVEEWAASSRRSLEVLARLPFFYWLMRAMIKGIMRRSFPAEGWETEWVETSGEVLAFNMKRCFYLDMLEALGEPELTVQFCRMDDLIYEGLSPYVRWARTGTLGRGDACCDFRFERVRR